MKQYEALFIIDPDKEKSLEEIINNITNGITKSGGKIDTQEKWGKQRLAHPIRKNREGIYYKLNFSSDPSEISALNKNFRLNLNILRAMITAR